ncbi:MAG: metal-dependent hydrolase [Chitinophagales bacterium]|nr:metal-dependent hydrolase [Chitinophagales bacterium]MDW8419071.1 metal-dependent hydrolase [Chitinophagales bacterium]
MALRLTYYGHACFSVAAGGKSLLFDPFIRPNELAKHIDVSAIHADYIFISHAHFDHLADAQEIAARCKATVVSNYEIAEWFAQKGLQVHHMNHGGKWKFDFGTVKYVAAIHTSSFPDGAYGGQPGGFVAETPDGNFYYSGDTALTMDMQLIPLTCAPLTAAILCIGDNFTMGVEDAVHAAQFVKCRKVVGVHYDTFGYIRIDKDAARKKFADAGLELLLPAIGETIEIK